MRIRHVMLIAALIVVSAFLAAHAATAPQLSEARVEPAVVQPGGHAVLTAKVEDPLHGVAQVMATVVEYPAFRIALNDEGKGDDKQAGNGLWTGSLEVPGEAPSGLYHLDVQLFDAAGNVIAIDGQPLKTTVAVEVKQPTAAATLASEQLLAAAAPWRTEAQIAKITARTQAEPLRFVVIGDSRSNPTVFRGLLEIAARLKPGFSVNTGDIVQGGAPQEFADFFTQINDVIWPFLIVPGNHDLGASAGRLYAELFGPSDYSFDHAGFRFIGVDNSRGMITAKQLEWLEQALTTDLRKIVFMHSPPAVIRQWDWHAFSMGAQEFADLVAAKKVERVYLGHIHGFAVAEYKAVRYVISGGGGAGIHPQIAPGNFHHLLLVEALNKGLRETVVKADGTSFAVDADKWIGGKGQ